MRSMAWTRASSSSCCSALTYSPSCRATTRRPTSPWPNNTWIRTGSPARSPSPSGSAHASFSNTSPAGPCATSPSSSSRSGGAWSTTCSTPSRWHASSACSGSATRASCSSSSFTSRMSTRRASSVWSGSLAASRARRWPTSSFSGASTSCCAADMSGQLDFQLQPPTSTSSSAVGSSSWCGFTALCASGASSAPS